MATARHRIKQTTAAEILAWLAFAYVAYTVLARFQNSGVTIIPPDEPAKLQPSPPPVTLEAYPVGSRFHVRR